MMQAYLPHSHNVAQARRSRVQDTPVLHSPVSENEGEDTPSLQARMGEPHVLCKGTDNQKRYSGEELKDESVSWES